MRECYNVDFFDNNLCASIYESCGMFYDGDDLKQGCILSEHCGTTGSYRNSDNVKFECPSGIKEIHYHRPIAFMYSYEYTEYTKRI